MTYAKWNKNTAELRSSSVGHRSCAQSDCIFMEKIFGIDPKTIDDLNIFRLSNIVLGRYRKLQQLLYTGSNKVYEQEEIHNHNLCKNKYKVKPTYYICIYYLKQSLN